MPNDPRVKFKKRIYDPSRNLFEERTGGGGGNPPGGGGYVPPSVIPDKPYNPPPHVDPTPTPSDPFLPFIPSITPFDPYHRKIRERADALRDKMIADENARLKVKPIVKPQVIDRPRPKSGVLDDMLDVDEDSGTIPKDVTGPFQPMRNQFGLKFKITPIDQPSSIPRTINANSTGTQLQDRADDLEKQIKAQNKLTSDLDTLSGETIAKRVSKMQAEGKSQEYIDAAVKIIRRNQLAKTRKAALLTPEEHLELLEITLQNPNASADEIAKIKSNIDMLKAQIKSNLDLAKAQQKADLSSKTAKLQQKIDDASADLAKPNTPAQDKYLRTQRTKAQNDLSKLQGDSLDIQKAKLKDKLAKIDDEISIASNQDQVAILEKQKVGIQRNLKALEDVGAQPAKPAQPAQSSAKSFEAIKERLETKILDIIDQISKSKDIRKNAQLVRQRKVLEKQLEGVENSMKAVQKTQQVIDNVKQQQKNMELIKAGKTPPPPKPPAPAPAIDDGAGVFGRSAPAPAPAPAPASARSADSIRIEQRLAALRDVATPGATTSGATTSGDTTSADYLNLPPAPPQPEEGEMQEMGSLAPKNHIAEFDNLVDTLVETAKESGFKVPEAPDSIQAEGELAVKKYVYEQALEFAEANNIFLSEYAVEKGVLKPTGKAKSKTDQLKVLDEFYQRAVSQQASQQAGPSQASSSSSVRRPTGTPPASAPASPPEFAEDWLDINQGTQAPTAPKPADITARLNDQFGSGSGSGSGSRQGTGSARADSILDTLDTIDSQLGSAATRPPKGSTGGGTPPYSPNPSQRPSQRRQGETQPMEMDTVPLIDSAPGSARPSARGKAKITKAPAPKAPQAPKAKFNFGRDTNIQGGHNINVASEFTNSVAGKFGSSLKGLSSRVPTLKPPSTTTLKAVGANVGATGAGIAIGIGVSYLMAQYFKEHPATDRFSQLGQQYAVGFAGATAGNLVMRAISIAGRLGMKTFTKAGAQLAAREALYATGEAGAFVAIQMAIEMSIETVMDAYNFSHAASKTTAAFVSGVVGMGVGFKQGGIAGLALMTGFAAYSTTMAYFEGKEMDEAEAKGRAVADQTTANVNYARLALVKNMGMTNNYDKAYDMLSQSDKERLALVGPEAEELFRHSLEREFDPLSKEKYGNPFLPKDEEPETTVQLGQQGGVRQGLLNLSGANFLSLGENWLFYEGQKEYPYLVTGGISQGYEEYQAEQVRKENEEKDKYYQEYINWYVSRLEKPGATSSSPPQGAGLALLQRDMGDSWRASAELNGTVIYNQTVNYNRVVNNAREQVVAQWHENTTEMNQIEDKELVETANLGGGFEDAYNQYIIQDATVQLTAQFNNNGTNYRDADPRLVAIAGRDPSVLPALDKYYEVMTQLSKDTELSVAELARLNALPQDEQGRELGKINAIRERVIRGGLLSDKAAVDEFNANLIREMQSYGDNFEEIMRNINDQQMLMGYSYLYGTTKTDFYKQLHLEAPVVVIENPYAGYTSFDYNNPKNRTPNDTLMYGYRYNLVDSQNQELEEWAYVENRKKYKKDGVELSQWDILAHAEFLYNRDREIYRKSDEEIAREQNMTLAEYYEEYGYDMDAYRPDPIEWKDIAHGGVNFRSDEYKGLYTAPVEPIYTDPATVNTKGDRAIADAKARGVYIEPTQTKVTLTPEQQEKQDRKAAKNEMIAQNNGIGSIERLEKDVSDAST